MKDNSRISEEPSDNNAIDMGGVPEEYMSSLGRRLKYARLLSGFTQESLARVICVDRSTYTCYESDKTMPNPTMLARLAKTMHVPLEFFFWDNDSNSMKKLVVSDIKVDKRSRKKPKLDPNRVSELSSEEKVLIAYVRAKEIKPDIAQKELEHIFGEIEPPRNTKRKLPF